MGNKEVKRQMKELWKQTFHDPDEYINLVFDNYFNPYWVEYEIVNNKIISSLLAIPFEFEASKSDLSLGINSISDSTKTKNADDNKNSCYLTLKGLYLCGLATDTGFRSKGIMSKLLKRIYDKAYSNNIAFVFLIPADDVVKLYYKRRGYVDVCYDYIERYTPIHSFNSALDTEKICNIDIFYSGSNGCENSIVDNAFMCNSRVFYESDGCCKIYNDIPSVEVTREINEFITECNSKINSVNIKRNDKDYMTICRETILSNGIIVVSRNRENRITGVLFSQNKDQDTLLVKFIAAKNLITENILLYSLQKFTSSKFSIEVVSKRDNFPDRIFAPYALSDTGLPITELVEPVDEIATGDMLAKPFGMAKIIKLSEILIFAAALYPSSKYSILVKSAELPGNVGYYEISGGTCRKSELTDYTEQQLADLTCLPYSRRSAFDLTVDEIAKFIWRRPSKGVDEFIDIPQLPLNFFLMLE